MAHLVSFTVEGLAGRDGSVEFELDRHLNVFFGLNGSGKTSLLTILHSALRNDGSLLRRIAFKSARVVLYSEDNQREFVLETTKVMKSPNRPDIAYSIDERGELVAVGSDAAWIYRPKLPSTSSGKWSHRYLPTWRMYVDEGRRTSGAPWQAL